MGMIDIDKFADRFVMRLPGQGTVVREVVITGSDLTYRKHGALSGGTVTSITLVTSDKKNGDSVKTWTSEGVSVAALAEALGGGYWNHVNNIREVFDTLAIKFPRDTGGGDTGGGDTGGGDTGGGDTGGGDTGGGDTGGGDTGGGDGGNSCEGRTIIGTSDKDRIRGTDCDDLIYGKESNDRIRGRDGQDTIHGGSGDDRIRGDRGDDVVNGNSGDDRLRGDRGNDTMDGGSGDDRLRGDKGDDLMIDLAGDNRLIGGAGEDTIATGDGKDVMVGGGGNDVIVAGGGKDVAMGQDGGDTFVFCSDDSGELRIRDFDATQDKLDICDIGSAVEELAAFFAESIQVGDDIVWQHGDMKVILEGTHREEVGLLNFAGSPVLPDGLL